MRRGFCQLFSSEKYEFLNNLVNTHFQYWVTRATPKEDEESNNNNNNNNMGTSKGKRRKSEEKKERKERRRESQVEERYEVDVGPKVHSVSACPNIPKIILLNTHHTSNCRWLNIFEPFILTLAKLSLRKTLQELRMLSPSLFIQGSQCKC